MAVQIREDEFVDVLVDVQSSLVSLCLEATEHVGREGDVRLAYVYASIEEGMASFNAFFRLADGSLPALDELVTDDDLYSQVCGFAYDDLDRLRKACSEFGRPCPTEVRVRYDAVDDGYTSHCSYEPKVGREDGEGRSPSVIFRAWLDAVAAGDDDLADDRGATGRAAGDERGGAPGPETAGVAGDDPADYATRSADVALRPRSQFDAADNGTFAEFEGLYQGDPNALLPGDLGLSMLVLATSSPRLANSDRLAIVRRLLADGADPNVAERSHGLAPLHLVFTSSGVTDPDELLALVRALLRAGANPDAVDSTGSTPLFYAICLPALHDSGALAIARELVSAGADPLHVNAREQTPLAAAQSLADRAQTAAWLELVVSEGAPGTADAAGEGAAVATDGGAASGRAAAAGVAQGAAGRHVPLVADDSAYGGFVVSNNVLAGIPARFAFREPSGLRELNGWTVYSDADDDAYVNDASNFTVVTASTLARLAPALIDAFDAPYGTDLALLYDEDGNFSGYWDNEGEREVTLGQVLAGEARAS